MNYWRECIESAFDEAGITATDEQINSVAADVKVSHENYGMMHGYDRIDSQSSIENDRLKEELRREKEKTICPECKGSGRKVVCRPHHSSESDCYKCRGRGFIYVSQLNAG